MKLPKDWPFCVPESDAWKRHKAAMEGDHQLRIEIYNELIKYLSENDATYATDRLMSIFGKRTNY